MARELSRYVEGYYYQDEKLLEDFNADTTREIIQEFRNSYPEKKTPQEIASKMTRKRMKMLALT
jgi:hypothetical protein